MRFSAREISHASPMATLHAPSMPEADGPFPLAQALDELRAHDRVRAAVAAGVAVQVVNHAVLGPAARHLDPCSPATSASPCASLPSIM